MMHLRRPVLESVDALRKAGLLDNSFSEEDGQRLIKYAISHHLQLDAVNQDCYLIDEGAGPAIAVSATAFFRICSATNCWRQGRVSFQVLDEPVGMICIASCFTRDEPGEPWREVSDHARYRDFVARNLDKVNELLDPKPPADSLWNFMPSRLLQEAAQVQAAIAALGDRVLDHLPEYHEPMCLTQYRYLTTKGRLVIAPQPD